ncbi:glycosyltransferase [Paenibacillus lycopersici]|uniref:Glycosyltransferase n=1 Tax=Paenibacillus lycopersici TaxID=2704462 RepID=A0A6C0G3F3_9BACL|nr:glycosyltransferase [Paenibacillus lycopersici]QHT62281.1 glycosyltransferase [Paenibacillus lycopersici]
MSSPFVSIIIPFYNDPYVSHAITSALEQTYPNKEIIIVSDGATKHKERLLPYLRHQGVYLYEKDNGGTASALNAGIRIAAGDYIAWLSSDDRFYPNKLENQLAYMLPRNGEISFSDYDVIDGSGSVVSQNVTPKYTDVFAFYKAFEHYCPINGCTVVARKKLLTDLGLFDEALPYTHDYDLWFRAVLSGADFHYVNEPLIQYRVHEAMGSMRHLPVIQLETETTKQRWWPQLSSLIERLGKS